MRCSGLSMDMEDTSTTTFRSEINSCLLVWNINFLLTLLIGVTTWISLPLLIADIPPEALPPLCPDYLSPFHTDDGINECTRYIR